MTLADSKLQIDRRTAPLETTATDDRRDDWYDDETGLFGRRFWAAIVVAELERCTRYGRTATVVMVKLAGLTGHAATSGSSAATQAAVQAASILKSASRSSDYVARTRPYRFAVLLPETDAISAINYVERVRGACDSMLERQASGVRCAFGWAEATASRSLIAAASLALTRLAADEQ